MADPLLGDAENTLVFILQGGVVTIDLFTEVAPQTVERVKLLASERAYDDVAFHRVAAGAFAQGGDVQFGDLKDYDPVQVGRGGSSLPDLPLEASDIPFDRGILGMARAADPNSGNSQFFIMMNRQPGFDESYTVWGEVTYGMQFVDQIKPGEGSNFAVLGVPDRIISAFVADELAPGNTSVGTGKRDRWTGGAEDEAFLGLGGRDVAKMGRGDDVVGGGEGNDRILLGGGRDRGLGEVGDDTVIGGNGADSVSGGAGQDRLVGNKGNDTLNGGAGDDTMKGGSGGDLFLYALEEFGNDRIEGFGVRTDRIDFTLTDYTAADMTLTAGDGVTVVSFDDGAATITIVTGADVIGSQDDVFLFA